MPEKIIKFLRRYLSPYFLPRHYLVRDIKKITRKYNFCGRILDVGCGSKPYQFLFKQADYQGIDFKNYSVNKDFIEGTPDYFFTDDYLKNLNLPFEPESFEAIVSFQVLEHHRNPAEMVAELYRITKKGGYLLISCPFLWPLHEEPSDYFRFSEHGLKELFKNYSVKILEIKKQGAIFSTASILFNEYLNNFAAGNKFNYFISLFIYPFFLFFQYLSFMLDKIFKSDKIFFSYLIVVNKQDF